VTSNRPPETKLETIELSINDLISYTQRNLGKSGVMDGVDLMKMVTAEKTKAIRKAEKAKKLANKAENKRQQQEAQERRKAKK
jgi:hypothetical protein